MDARRIRQVLINLLSNAIKYTEEGDVRFAVRLKDDVLEYVVSDTGYGIHESEIPVLFEPFERTTRAKELGIEGTGLGLPISRYLVHKHGGEMVVASEVGVGSTFSFTLPLHSPASESVDSRHQIPQGAQGD
jgi:signal transduction histidine kinase